MVVILYNNNNKLCYFNNYIKLINEVWYYGMVVFCVKCS